MLKLLIANEWLQWRRDKRLRILLVFLVCISLLALWHQLNFQSNILSTRQKAQHESRQEWLSQELKHPHMAAHFGNYAYKKPSILYCFDPGLTIYTGTSVYMEPHRQNDLLFSQSQESDTGVRFGWLSAALICQLIIPLLIIVLTFNIVSTEYEKGTLSLLRSQGVTFNNLLVAKTLAVFIVFEIFLTTYILLTAVCSVFIIHSGVDIITLLYLWIIYSSYFLVWALTGVLVSSYNRNAGNAISLLLLLWMFTNIIAPRISANLAENIYPIETNYQFKTQVSEAIKQGLDGHDSQDERSKKLEKELLTKYKVDSVEQLPFNFEGYLMLQSEEYSSKVYDRFFGEMFNGLKKQKQVQAYFSILSPFISVRNISMAASNASLETEIDFQQQAEKYRRAFVQDMNKDMMNNSAYGSFDTYKVANGKYKAIHDLQIENQPLKRSLNDVIIENVWLLIWLATLLTMLLRKSKKQTYR